MRYIALLRGINVGGHIVKMDRLRAIFAGLGLANVRSYIQSGNVFFDSDAPDPYALQILISTSLTQSLGFAVPVCLRTIDALASLLQDDPFSAILLTGDKRFAVTFLAEPTSLKLTLPYATPDGGYEVIAQTPTELFVVWHLLNGRPGSSYGYLEKSLGVPTTTRFWHTLANILAAANANPSSFN